MAGGTKPPWTAYLAIWLTGRRSAVFAGGNGACMCAPARSFGNRKAAMEPLCQISATRQ